MRFKEQRNWYKTCNVVFYTSLQLSRCCCCEFQIDCILLERDNLHEEVRTMPFEEIRQVRISFRFRTSEISMVTSHDSHTENDTRRSSDGKACNSMRFLYKTSKIEHLLQLLLTPQKSKKWDCSSTEIGAFISE